MGEVPGSLRVWRIPYSTNCERVAIAAGVRGVLVEWVDVDAYDRAPVEEVSGQKRVPVAELDGEILVGSLAIVNASPPTSGRSTHGAGAGRPVPRVVRPRLDASTRILFRRARTTPAATERARASSARSTGSGSARRRRLPVRPVSVADVAAYPFLKYATDKNPDDDHKIHRLMRRHQSVEGRPQVAAWLARVSALPRS
jgi:glutathione S-transferase